jgi:hypothetical protein
MNNLPYIKKLEDVEDFSVWEVDGKYIRDHINREFTNFGQHFRFPFIPKHELWIDKEYAPGEENFFVDHMLYEWHLMSQGVSYDDSVGKGDNKEKRERLKSKILLKAKEEQEKKHITIPKELYKEKLDGYGDILSVWIVNGELVRDLFYIEYTEGGHHFIYKFIPKNEVWIDDDLSPKERGYVILHELHERFLMSKGYDYSKAHASSSAIEYKCRREPDKLKKCLEDEIAKNNTI